MFLKIVQKEFARLVILGSLSLHQQMTLIHIHKCNKTHTARDSVLFFFLLCKRFSCLKPANQQCYAPVDPLRPQHMVCPIHLSHISQMEAQWRRSSVDIWSVWMVHL